MFENFPHIKTQELLSKHCWYALGGPADYFIEITSREELDQIPELIHEAKQHDLPYFILGGGSNTVFHDEGLRGLVIKITASEFNIITDENGNPTGEIIAQPGALMTQIAKASIEAGLTGIESLYGLPGTIGGAGFGNAEAHKTSTGDFVKSVTLYNPNSLEPADATRELGSDYFEFLYRHSLLHETKEIVLKVTLQLKKATQEEAAAQQNSLKKAEEALNFRKEKQPAGRNNGSFFKNPPGDFAGRLIDVAGLKGTKIGGAYISEKHGNFFMNDGTATTQDLIDLRSLARATVREEFDVNLEEEVRIVMPDGRLLQEHDA